MSFLRNPFTSNTESTPPVYYHRSPTRTRIDNCEELAIVVKLVEGIRSKVDELQAASEKKGAGKVDFLKHLYMKALLDKVDEKIGAFNAKNQQPVHEQELAEVLPLAGELKSIVDGIFTDKTQLDVIKTKRDNNKENALAGTESGLPGSTAALAVVSNYTFFYGSVLCGIAAGGGQYLKKHFNLGNLDTASQTLLTNLHTALDELGKKQLVSKP